MCKDQESIQSSTTPDPGYQWESDKIMFVVIKYFSTIKLLSRSSSVQNCFDENIYVLGQHVHQIYFVKLYENLEDEDKYLSFLQ